MSSRYSPEPISSRYAQRVYSDMNLSYERLPEAELCRQLSEVQGLSTLQRSVQRILAHIGMGLIWIGTRLQPQASTTTQTASNASS